MFKCGSISYWTGHYFVEETIKRSPTQVSYHCFGAVNILSFFQFWRQLLLALSFELGWSLSMQQKTDQMSAVILVSIRALVVKYTGQKTSSWSGVAVWNAPRGHFRPGFTGMKCPPSMPCLRRRFPRHSVQDMVTYCEGCTSNFKTSEAAVRRCATWRFSLRRTYRAVFWYNHSEWMYSAENHCSNRAACKYKYRVGSTWDSYTGSQTDRYCSQWPDRDHGGSEMASTWPSWQLISSAQTHCEDILHKTGTNAW